MTAWEWPGTRLVRVVDGDTFDALVSRDLGFGGTATYPVRLRLNRINAPKLGPGRGIAARDHLIDLLATPTVFDLVTVKPYKYGGPADQRGEYMAEVTVPAGNGRVNVSDAMVSAGMAVYWSGAGARPGDDGP